MSTNLPDGCGKTKVESAFPVIQFHSVHFIASVKNVSHPSFMHTVKGAHKERFDEIFMSCLAFLLFLFVVPLLK